MGYTDPHNMLDGLDTQDRPATKQQEDGLDATSTSPSMSIPVPSKSNDTSSKTTVRVSSIVTSPAPSLTRDTSRTPSPTTTAPELTQASHPVKIYGNHSKGFKYTREHGSAKIIGSRAYYKSWPQQKKKYDRRDMEAIELGPLLPPQKGKKVVKGKGWDGVGRRKVDERWRRLLVRQ
jgi:hypothetical protein